MKSLSPRMLALGLAVLSTPGLFAQRPGGGGAELTVSVAVAPICTIAIRQGESSPEQAVAVRCRNFGAMQPPPIVSSDSDRVDDVASSEDTTLIVINF